MRNADGNGKGGESEIQHQKSRIRIIAYRGFSTRYVAERMARAFADLGCGVQGPDSAPPPPGSRLPTPDLSFVYYRWMRKDGAVRRPRALWLVDEPYQWPASLTWPRLFDWTFINERATLEAHGAGAGRHVYWLPPAYEPLTVTDPIRCDVALVGAGFPNRRALLRSILPDLSGRDVRLVGPDWPAAWHPRDEWVQPSEAARYYAGATVNLNIHRAPRTDYPGPAPTALNFRAFEIAAVGGFQILDAREDAAIFIPSAVTFDGTIKDLRRKVLHHLTHDAEREAIAAACRREAAPHTFEARARTVLQVVG